MSIYLSEHNILIDIDPARHLDNHAGLGWRHFLVLEPAAERADEAACVTTFSHVGPGIPMAVHERRALRWGLPPCTGHGLVLFVQEHAATFAALSQCYEGAEVNAQGNRIGRWHADSEGPWHAIQARLETAGLPCRWDAGDLLAPVRAEEVDAAVEALAEGKSLTRHSRELAASQEADGILVEVDDVRSCLEHWIGERRKSIEDAVERSWKVSPRDQGQMIEYAYAVGPHDEIEDGATYLYRRTLDRSMGIAVEALCYERVDALDVYGDIEPWNEPPQVDADDWKVVA